MGGDDDDDDDDDDGVGVGVSRIPTAIKVCIRGIFSLSHATFLRSDSRILMSPPTNQHW